MNTIYNNNIHTYFRIQHHRDQHLTTNPYTDKTPYIITLEMHSVGTRAHLEFNAQECTNKALTTGPFGNTCEADEISPEVEVGVVERLRCLQP
jgi:hypothetical protein